MIARSASIALAFAITLAACAKGSHDEPVASTAAAATGPVGFCRTTTCEPPAGYPTAELCQPIDWASECSFHELRSNAPLWWRSSCIGYDLQKQAGRKVSYDTALAAVETAFAAWTRSACPTQGDGSSKASLEVHDLGPVDCAARGYDPQGANQNLVVFHDDAWPYEAEDRKKQGGPKSMTIALTTVTFDHTTGEIFDADLEINSADYDVVPTDSPSGDTVDLESVLVHETGHFLGLAHSPRPASVMFGSAGGEGAGTKRTPTAEDVAGICTIYPPNGTRSVSTLVEPSGSVAASACDPTPRHGLTGECVPPRSCSAAPFRASDGAWFFVGVAALAIAFARRRLQVAR